MQRLLMFFLVTSQNVGLFKPRVGSFLGEFNPTLWICPYFTQRVERTQHFKVSGKSAFVHSSSQIEPFGLSFLNTAQLEFRQSLTWFRRDFTRPSANVIVCESCCVFPGPRCLVRCRDQMTAPAQAEGVQTSSSERRHLRRSEIWWLPRRKRPRSPVKPLPNSPPVPRGNALFICEEMLVCVRETVFASEHRPVLLYKKKSWN